jgi:transcriptional regulator with XRE-family HTH domain
VTGFEPGATEARIGGSGTAAAGAGTGGSGTAAAGSGSSVPRRQLGRYLRDLRHRAGLTVRTAARRLEWSETKIWRIETGQTSLRSLDVEAICRIYAAPADLIEPLLALARESKAPGWWLSYSTLTRRLFDVYTGLEEAANRLRWYETELVPGMLQTERYARLMIGLDNPDLDDAEVERRVQLRMARRRLLTRPIDPLRVQVVLSDAVLRRPIGGPGLMAEQLTRLAEIAELTNVLIKVVPYHAGVHRGVLSGPFTMLDFPINADGRPSEPATVYVEGFVGALFLEKPHEVERFGTVFADLWSAACDEAESRVLIRTAAREFMR